MKLSLNKFLLIFFLTTSILPILGLSIIHIGYLHELFNKENKSFIELIEHEELILFSIYSCTVVLGIGTCLLLFRKMILDPITNLMNQLDDVARGKIPKQINNSRYSLKEVSSFIGKFNQMIAILQDSKRQRNDFIATLTHDLKTPLLAEQKAFKLLKDYSLDDQHKTKIINSLIHSNNDLVALLDMLLGNLKYESGEIELKKTPKLNANDFFQESLSSFYPLFNEHDINVELIVDPNSSLNIDISQFKRVLSNLMFNALENSPAQTKVEVKLQELESQILITVADQGYGISAERLETIFERYASTKDKPGAGLGLYVSKLIIEKHGGTIRAFSKINEGSKFEILLPK